MDGCPVPVAAGLFRLWVRISTVVGGGGVDGCPSVVSVVCCQVERLCDKLITHPQDCYRLWCVVVCDLETSRIRTSCPALCRSATGGEKFRVESSVGYTRDAKKVFVVIMSVQCFINFWYLSDNKRVIVML
jgi:hypothetical protein